MTIADKTNKQLIEELEALRLHTAELEEVETERKRADEVPGRSEKDYRRLFELSPVGITLLDMKGVITYCNSAVYNKSGYSESDYVGKHFSKLTPARVKDVPKFIQTFNSILRGKIPKPFEVRYQRKDGTSGWTELHVDLLKIGGKRRILTIQHDITERKQSEEALQAEKNKLQSLVDALEYGLTIQDKDYNIIYQNEITRSYFGDHVGEKCYRVYGDGKKACEDCPVEKAFKDGKSHTGERRRVRPSGEGIFWENTASPIRDAKGKIVACLEITRDITERKQAEEALQQSNRRFGDIAKNALEWIWEVDAKGKYTYTSPVVEKILGYKPEEVLEKNFYDLFHPDDREELKKAAFEVFAKKQPFRQFVNRNIHKNGEIVWLSTSGVPILDEEGNLLGYRGADVDITERTQVEETLQTEKNKLQSLIEAMEDGLTIQDAGYNIIFQNELVRTLFGDRLGEKCYRVYEGREKLCDGCPVEKAFKDGKSHSSERRVVLPSGEVTFWENTANPIRDAKGEIVSCLEINRNITERKQAEEALRRTSEDLQLVSMINNAANRGYSLRRILQLLTQGTKKIFSCYEATFYNCSEDKKYLIVQKLNLHQTMVSRIEKLIRMKIPPVRIRLQEDSLYLKALQAGKPRIINDPETIQRLMAECTENKLLKKLAPRTYRFLNIHSVMQAPLISEGEVIGLLDVSRKQPFTELELERFATIAQQLLLIIKRKRAEGKLRESEERYRNLFESSHDMIQSVTPDGHFIFVNQAWLETMGYTKAELPELNLFKIIHPDSLPHCRETFSKVMAGEVVTNIQATFVAKDGRLVQVEGNAAGRYVGGELYATQGIFRDITERKQAEEKIQQQNEFLNNILNSLTHPFYVLDVKDYTIKMANLAAKMGDLSENQTCYSLTHKKDKPCGSADHVCPLEEVKKTKKPIVTEHVHYDEDGNPRNIEVHGYPIFDTKGNVVQMIEYCLDITERKQVEDTLADEAIRRRILIEQSRDGIVVLDENSKVYEANQRFAEMLGYSPEEVRELHTWDWDTQWTREELLEMGRNVNATGLRLETYHRRKDGTTIDVDISINGAVCAGQKLIFCVCRDITERKRGEKALLEAEEKYKNLVETTGDIIWEAGEEGMFTFMSPRIKDILGYEVNEVVDKRKTLDFVPKGEARKWLTRFKEINAKKKPFSGFEITHIHKNGNPVVFEISGTPFFDNVGNFKGFIGINKDITERKQAEEEIERQKAYFQQLFDNSPEGIALLDDAHRFVQVNKGFETLFGYRSKEIKGRFINEIIAPEDRGDEASALSGAALGNQIRRKETVRKRKDGSLVDVDVIGYPIRFDNQTVGVYAIYSDITERKQAERALRESQEFSISLLENSPNPKFVVNPDTSVKYVNPAFEKLTGFTLAEITGREAPYPWWPEEQWRETTASFKNAMVTGGRRSERAFRKKNGERFWVALNSAPVMHEEEVIYFIVSWLDITERRRMEEERLELEQKAHLASRLASVGEMAAGIAHEINNPMTAVIGFAQLLMETDLPDDVKEDISVIHKEAQRAAGVARNLLTFARKHALAKQLTNMNSIIEEVLKLRAYEQSVSNIRVNTRFASDLPEVMVDYSQMQQVFINIILNAEAAMLEANNRGTLTVTTQRVNDTVRASFTDSGPGVAKENLNRIFDPFFTTKEVGEGTGLGLSVCHGIVAEHGGRIYARSRLGGGATFVVELPVNAHASGERS